MRPGPKGAPPELRVLRGDPKCRRNPDAPPATGAPEMPPYLNVIAREEWGRIVAELSAAGVVARTDRAALEIYSVTYAYWLQARALIAEHGMLIATPDGGRKANPAVGIAGACARLMLQFLTEFGATPAARSRVRAGGEQPDDALEAFLRTRKP